MLDITSNLIEEFPLTYRNNFKIVIEGQNIDQNMIVITRIVVSVQFKRMLELRENFCSIVESLFDLRQFSLKSSIFKF